MLRHPLILIELNEINFDLARPYVAPLGLKNLHRLMTQGMRKTQSEDRYERLEPWIQWVSAHTGLSGVEHGIFRLGDIVGSRVPQFFEQVEAGGFSVGAVSPMNAENRLNRPAYFIPDPWTQTPTDGSALSRRLWQALSQVVIDNAKGRISATSAAVLFAALLRFARPINYPLYLTLARGALKAPWRRALLLDLFLHDIHMRLMLRHRPHFSTLFLNAGAHIQHHYLFNGRLIPVGSQRNPDWYVDRSDDPFAEMLRVYDVIVGDYLAVAGSSLLLATGLTQVPYDRVKYYWRLRDHGEFLRLLGLNFARTLPRMTRDFDIEFENTMDAERAYNVLSALKMADDGMSVFGELENRGKRVFATLTYPKEVRSGMQVLGGPAPFDLASHVVFVAIKNGMHASHGFVAATGDASLLLPRDGDHVKSLHSTVLRYFGLSAQPAASQPPASLI
jgi:hypothetical protein